MKTRPTTMTVANTGMGQASRAQGVTQIKMAMGMPSYKISHNMSSKASTGFGFASGAKGPNAYSEAASSANRAQARVNIPQMSAASSSNIGGSMQRSAFNLGMPLASKPAARAGAAPMMSAGFNIEGAQNN